MSGGDIVTAPVLDTLLTPVLVKRPENEAAPPEVSELGGASIGMAHVPGIGDVIHVALHAQDGTTLIGTFNRAAIIEFATKMNGFTARINNGLNRPETTQ
jgi:hypothetical protein